MSLSQNDRVLRLLRMRGEYGTTVNDWDRGQGVPAIDGGERITRLSARITDLKNAGHRVEPIEKREGFTVYALLAPVPERERPDVAAVACAIESPTYACADGHIQIRVEVLHPGWTITSRGYERTSERRAA